MPTCPSCGTKIPEGFKFCGGCGSELPAAAAPAPAPAPVAAGRPLAALGADGSWQAVGRDVRHITQRIHIDCARCAAPIPVNGPCRSVHCDQCMSDMPIDLVPELELAGEGMQRMGSPFQRRQFSEALPDCASCGADVPIDGYLDHVGARTTIPCPSCGAELPTYPAPPWLREALPHVLQVFGGDPEVAARAAGLSVDVDPSKPEPIVMACPKCGGGLTVTAEAERTVRCEFCSASVFLPDELWKRLHPVKTAQAWTLTYWGSQLESAETIRQRQHDAEVAAQQRQRMEERQPAFGTVDGIPSMDEVVAAQKRRNRWMSTVAVVVSVGIPLLILALVHC